MNPEHYPYYDTAIVGTSAGVATLFTKSEGDDSSKASQFTNMQIGGQFEASQEYLIKKVYAYCEGVWSYVDREDFWDLSYFKLINNNTTKLQLPMRRIAKHDAYNGQYSQASATLISSLGLVGDGFTLDIPILIKGGEQFRVELTQINALAVANMQVKFYIDGIRQKLGTYKG